MLFESLLAKLATASLVAKAAAGGAAVVVATSAAGAADALPDGPQQAFDAIVQTDEEPVEADEAAEEEATEGDNSEFGTSVSEDATGVDDEPGVNGAQIACEASEGRSQTRDGSTDTEIDCEDVDSTQDVDGDNAESDAMKDFGDDVSKDATGADGSDPGVVGEDISSDARELNPGEGEEGVEDAPADVEGGPEGTLGEEAANTNPLSNES